MLVACSITPEQPDYATLISAEQQRVEQWQNFPQQTDVAYLNDLIDTDMFEGLLQTAMQSNPSLQQTLLTLQIRQSQLTQAAAENRPLSAAAFQHSTVVIVMPVLALISVSAGKPIYGETGR